MTKIDRKAWVNAALDGVRAGKYPPEIVIKELAAELKVTSGSFYQHFDNAADWYEASMEEWGAERQKSTRDVVHYARQFRDRRERIMSYRTAAKGNAVADKPIRTWSATASAFSPGPGAAAADAALQTARQPILEALEDDLTHLGLAPRKAGLAARVLLREFGLGPGDPSVPLDDDDGFAELLDLFVPSKFEALKVPVKDLAGSRAVAHIVVMQAEGGGPVDAGELAENAAKLFGPALRTAADLTAAEADTAEG